MRSQSKVSQLVTEMVRYKLAPKPVKPPIFPNHQRLVWFAAVLICTPVFGLMSFACFHMASTAIETGIFKSGQEAIDLRASPVSFYKQIILSILMGIGAFAATIAVIRGFIRAMRA